MEKRTREDDDQFLNHGRRRVIPGGGDSNCFDRLPDDVVIKILERLDLNDAAETRTLSRRFLGLWKLLIQYKKNLGFIKFTNFCPGFSLDGWDKLTSLTLKSVQVRRSHLERWLKKGLINLESLFIEQAFDLGTLEVSSRSLKRLELSDCSGLYHVNIDFAPNLEFFKQTNGPTWRSTQLCINGAAPKLSHVCLEASLFDYRLLNLHNARVKKLELLIGFWVRLDSYDWMKRLRDLKELKITFPIKQWSFFFFPILSLVLPACPQLQKLALYCSHFTTDFYDHGWKSSESRARSRVHEHLKVVEFGNWSGREDEVQAANWVKEIAPNLEKITYV